MLSRHGDELDELAVDEAAFLLTVALASQPPSDEVPSAERARLLQRLAEGRAGSAADVVRRARSVGVDLSRATLWAVHGRGSLERLERMGMDALVDGRRAVVAVRGDTDIAAVARDLVRRGAVTAVGLDARGDEPAQLRDALHAAECACLVAAAAGPPVQAGRRAGGAAGGRPGRARGRAGRGPLRRGDAARARGAGRHGLVEGGRRPPPGRRPASACTSAWPA